MNQACFSAENSQGKSTCSAKWLLKLFIYGPGTFQVSSVWTLHGLRQRQITPAAKLVPSRQTIFRGSSSGAERSSDFAPSPVTGCAQVIEGGVKVPPPLELYHLHTRDIVAFSRLVTMATLNQALSRSS